MVIGQTIWRGIRYPIENIKSHNYFLLENHKIYGCLQLYFICLIINLYFAPLDYGEVSGYKLMHLPFFTIYIQWGVKPLRPFILFKINFHFACLCPVFSVMLSGESHYLIRHDAISKVTVVIKSFLVSISPRPERWYKKSAVIPK